MVYEEAIDLHLGLLEAGERSPDGPWSMLRPLGRSETRTFRAVVLENVYLRVTIVPELGGRIAAVHDLRTGIDILPRPANLLPVEGGPRGMDLPFGIEFVLDGGPRPNAMGPVRAAVDEDAEDPAVWLSESVAGQGLSWNLRISLPEGKAAIRLEARVLSRYEDVEYNGGFRISGLEEEGAAWSRESGGFVLNERDAPLQGGILRHGQVGKNRVLGFLRYRQSDAFEIELVAFSGIGKPDGVGPGGAYSWQGGVLQVQACAAHPGAKAVLLTEDGQTLEAPLGLDPSRIERIELGAIVPKELTVLGAEREALISSMRLPERFTWPDSGDIRDFDDRGLRFAERNVNFRDKAILERARRAMVAQRYEEAAELFERGLLYLGDDPLSWWGLAAARRLAGAESERPELLNARWLAPLEPLVRAELYLAAATQGDADPAGLLDPLEETPDAFVEVAAILADHGMWADLARWLNEALRRHDYASLHWIAAAMYHARELPVEAARHVSLARARPGPPFPWRPFELRSIAALEDLYRH